MSLVCLDGDSIQLLLKIKKKIITQNRMLKNLSCSTEFFYIAISMLPVGKRVNRNVQHPHELLRNLC